MGSGEEHYSRPVSWLLLESPADTLKPQLEESTQNPRVSGI